MRSDGTNDLIQGRWRSAAGALSDTQGLSAAGQHAVDQQVAVAPNGTATFVWQRSNGTSTIIQTRSRAPNGMLSAVQDLSAAGQYGIQPQVAIDPSGNASFVWTRFNGTNFIVQARRRLANGTLEKAQGISASDKSGFAPQLAVAPGGAATFVWRLDGVNAIIQTRRRFENGTFGGVQNLSAAGESSAKPQVAVDPNDNASFVWRREALGRREGPASPRAFRLPGADAFDVRVGVDQNDNVTFAWQRAGVIQTRLRTTSFGPIVGLSN